MVQYVSWARYTSDIYRSMNLKVNCDLFAVSAFQLAVLQRKLFERAPVHVALERHHLTQGIPVTDPAPIIKLGATAIFETNTTFITAQPQEKPFLFLTDAQRLRVVAHQTVW